MTCNLTVQMDNGEVQTFQAYRVQHNNARGPYKGGLRCVAAACFVPLIGTAARVDHLYWAWLTCRASLTALRTHPICHLAYHHCFAVTITRWTLTRFDPWHL